MNALPESRTGFDTAACAPFRLTALQHAYWVGEQDAYALHTPAYLYRCFLAVDVDVPRLEAAVLAALRARPDLCAAFGSDGRQLRVPAPTALKIAVHDLPEVTPHTAASHLARRRISIEDALPPPGTGLPFAFVVDRVAHGCYVHMLFRLIAFDAMSMWHFFSDIGHAYAHGRLPQPAQARFRDFIADRDELERTQSYQRSLDYWRSRTDLPEAPELLLVDASRVPRRSRFHRISFGIGAEQVEALHAKARACGVGINALLCTAYADVIRLWSGNASFIINLLVSHRPGEARFERTLGNFGSTLPVESIDDGGDFRERVRALQRRMLRNMKHMQVPGVEVMRLLGRTAGPLPAMPVVFASSLGLPRQDLLVPEDLGWQPCGGGLQTPQVLLDGQAYMDGDTLTINWDYVVDAFAPGMVETMFSTFRAHLADLAAAPGREGMHLPGVPAAALAPRRGANATAAQLPSARLETFIEEACQRFPQRTAIIGNGRTLSYDGLWRLATRLAARLRAEGLGPGDLVAIVADRGWRQVIAAVAVIVAGAAYLPVPGSAPRARIDWLLRRDGVGAVLLDSAHEGACDVPAGMPRMRLEDALPEGEPGPAVPLPAKASRALDDLAYVIFTSGSTGEPKGVMIEHRAVVNTLQDMIQRFGLNPEDRVLGVSAFSFDLSVFDIFSTLSVGAALVLPPPDAAPAPGEWARLIERHRVTVWNSVPALMEMLVDYLGARAKTCLASLRHVFLSGDWIPLALAGRLLALLPEARLVGLGGATEASIWSNWFRIDHVDPAWNSIPYGWPLSNQRFHILTRDLRDAPVGVVGQIHIAGEGLARGYHADAERTAERFIAHPVTGERLYATGDVGRYDEDGCVEFLGRNDDQVKVRGFRIELGEIDAALGRCSGVRCGAAIATRAGQRDRQIVALCVPRGDAIDDAALRAELARWLPEYMVPQRFLALDRLPITANGKVDRKALARVAEAQPCAPHECRAPRNDVERRLAALWRGLLDIDAPGIDDDFFECGGTSLGAVHLLTAIAGEFGCELPLALLLSHNTIARQAQALAALDASVSQREPVVTLREGRDAVLVAVHPVGGNVLCYRELTAAVPNGIAVLALQSPGDGAERSLGELAERYITALAAAFADGRSVHLLGWSMGGVVAHEMARRLEVAGRRVAGLTMVDSHGAANPLGGAVPDDRTLLRNFLRDLVSGAALPAGIDVLAGVDAQRLPRAVLELLRESKLEAGTLDEREFQRLLAEYRANYLALARHVPGSMRAPLQLVRARGTQAFPQLAPFPAPNRGPVVVHELDGDHFSVMRGDALRAVVAHALALGARAGRREGGAPLAVEADC